MKTFKLISLKVLTHDQKPYTFHPISLIDGLMIDRQDERKDWLLEAYIDRSYQPYFKALQKEELIIVKAKISKETNDPAILISTSLDMTEIGENMNVLLIGPIVKKSLDDLKERAAQFKKKGYTGQALIDQINQV